jgi:hypothetical protein
MAITGLPCAARDKTQPISRNQRRFTQPDICSNILPLRLQFAPHCPNSEIHRRIHKTKNSPAFYRFASLPGKRDDFGVPCRTVQVLSMVSPRPPPISLHPRETARRAARTADPTCTAMWIQ